MTLGVGFPNDFPSFHHSGNGMRAKNIESWSGNEKYWERRKEREKIGEREEGTPQFSPKSPLVFFFLPALNISRLLYFSLAHRLLNAWNNLFVIHPRAQAPSSSKPCWHEIAVNVSITVDSTYGVVSPMSTLFIFLARWSWLCPVQCKCPCQELEIPLAKLSVSRKHASSPPQRGRGQRGKLLNSHLLTHSFSSCPVAHKASLNSSQQQKFKPFYIWFAVRQIGVFTSFLKRPYVFKLQS